MELTPVRLSVFLPFCGFPVCLLSECLSRSGSLSLLFLLPDVEQEPCSSADGSGDTGTSVSVSILYISAVTKVEYSYEENMKRAELEALTIRQMFN